VTSSIKPEVHNISQRHQRRTKPRTEDLHTNSVTIGPAVLEICSWTETDWHTDRQTHRQTNWSQYSAPLLGQSKNKSFWAQEIRKR